MMLSNHFLRGVLCRIRRLVLLDMRCAHRVVNFEDRVARIVLLVLRWHYRNPIISLILQPLRLTLISRMRRALIKVLVVQVILHVRRLRARWFYRND